MKRSLTAILLVFLMSCSTSKVSSTRSPASPLNAERGCHSLVAEILEDNALEKFSREYLLDHNLIYRGDLEEISDSRYLKKINFKYLSEQEQEAALLSLAIRKKQNPNISNKKLIQVYKEDAEACF